MSKAVLMVLQGGFGNQLFQYAAGIVISKELGAQLWLSSVQENKHSGRDYRALLYTRGKPFDPTTFSGGPEFFFVHTGEPHDSWEPSEFRGLSPKATQLLFKGYFQHLPAIAPAISLIRSDVLCVLGEIRIQMQAKYSIQNTRELAFVHVRRGDYLNLPETDFWRQDIDNYYARALSTIHALNPAIKRIFVLSDDVAWCKSQQLFNEKGCECVDEADELNAMALMSLCHGGAAIANSTFSWWGAMFGPEAAGAPVVYPERWYKQARPQLFPDTWKMIQQT